MTAASVSLPDYTHIFLVAKPKLESEGQKLCICCSNVYIVAKLFLLETITKSTLQELSEISDIKQSSLTNPISRKFWRIYSN